MFVRYEIDRANNQIVNVCILDAPPPSICDRVLWLSERCVHMLLYCGINPIINELCMKRGIKVISGFHPDNPKQAIYCFLKNQSKTM